MAASAKPVPTTGNWAYTSKNYEWPLVMRYTHEACVAAHNAVGALDLAEREAKGAIFAEHRAVQAADVDAYAVWQQLEALLTTLYEQWERGLLR